MPTCHRITYASSKTGKQDIIEASPLFSSCLLWYVDTAICMVLFAGATPDNLYVFNSCTGGFSVARNSPRPSAASEIGRENNWCGLCQECSEVSHTRKLSQIRDSVNIMHVSSSGTSLSEQHHGEYFIPIWLRCLYSLVLQYTQKQKEIG